MEESPPIAPQADDRFDARFANLSGDAREVAAILDSLAKTSRAFRFYAANNRALRGFLGELYGLFDRWFAGHDRLELKIRPACFVWGSADEVVYEDDDRENGFPFKLYRDGIRALILGRGIAHDDILRLQKILSFRALGRLEEEDIATQLWRIRSKHIQFRQVRGFVDASQEVMTGGLGGGGGEAPALDGKAFAEFGSLELDGDQRGDLSRASRSLRGQWFDEWEPMDGPPAQEDPVYREIPEPQLKPFQGGFAFDPGAVLGHVVVRCLDAGRSGIDAAPIPSELRELLEEARYAHLVAGEVKPYRRVVKVLQNRLSELPAGDPWREALEGFLREGGGRSTVRLLLGSVGRKAAEPRRVLTLLRAMEAIDPDWLADALEDTPSEEGRQLVAHTVLELMWPDAEQVARLAGHCSPYALTSLISGLVEREHEMVMPLLADLFPDAQAVAQATIARAALQRESRDGLARLARRALDSRDNEVLRLGLRMALRAENPRLTRKIEAMVEPAALMEMSRETAVAALCAFAMLPGREKMDWMIRQAKPSALSLTRKADEQRIRFVMALGELATPKARRALDKLRGKGNAAYADAVEQAVQRADEGGRW
jgi:hypothetical protein